MAKRLRQLGLAGFASLALASAFAQTPLRIEQVRALPPLPKDYAEQTSPELRIAWLHQRLAQTQDRAERYRIRRALALEHVDAHRADVAATFCRDNPPLREDVIYRKHCIVAASPRLDEHLPLLLALVKEAREIGNGAAAAMVMRDLAWEQSQAGDIAGAFENFEAALSLVPSQRADVLDDIMLDTASVYIVNGDERYIGKGIELLKSIGEQKERALQDPADRSDKAELREIIQLTEFNQGIAYLLHLGDNEKALQHFDRVARMAGPSQAAAMSFAALAAAELRQLERAKAYAASATRLGSDADGPVVKHYLACYRQLAARHWNPGHSVSACLSLKPDTTTEVQLDVYKRLSRSEDPVLAQAGVKGLATLFTEKYEPQLRRRGSHAASNAELKRLQRESELKSMVLKQQADLQQERDATAAQRLRYFVALSLLLLMVTLLIVSQWRAKKKLADQFERLSLVDSLTQLGNRRFLEQHIERELSHLQRERRNKPEAALGLFLVDVDHFKAINDRHGHAAGDEVLVTFGRRVQHTTRETDLLVRWGGEEFLLVARLDTAAHGAQVASRILQAVTEHPFEVGTAAPIPVSCTIGTLTLPFLPGDAEQPWGPLIALADLALYEGKAQGRNRWVQVDNLALRDAAALTQALRRPLRESIDAGLLGIRSAAAGKA